MFRVGDEILPSFAGIVTNHEARMPIKQAATWSLNTALLPWEVALGPMKIQQTGSLESLISLSIRIWTHNWVGSKSPIEPNKQAGGPLFHCPNRSNGLQLEFQTSSATHPQLKLFQQLDSDLSCFPLNPGWLIGILTMVYEIILYIAG